MNSLMQDKTHSFGEETSTSYGSHRRRGNQVCIPKYCLHYPAAVTGTRYLLCCIEGEFRRNLIFFLSNCVINISECKTYRITFGHLSASNEVVT